MASGRRVFKASNINKIDDLLSDPSEHDPYLTDEDSHYSPDEEIGKIHVRKPTYHF